MLEFICNLTAGRGRSRRFREVLEERMNALGVAHRFHMTDRRGHAAELARRLSAGGATDIVCMGGDGTLHEVLNGLDDPSRVRLGIVPCGSGNDFAAAAGIPQSPEGALQLLIDGKARPTDYFECGGVRGINVIGTGIDVDILRRYSRMKLLKGSAAYLASLILTLFSYAPYHLIEAVDDRPRRHNAFIACAANGQRFGGGIPICPEAIIDDGLLDIVIIDDIARHAIPGAFMKLMKRQVLTLPTANHRRDVRLQVHCDGPMPLQIDGEIYENLPFDVRVISNALHIYRP